MVVTSSPGPSIPRGTRRTPSEKRRHTLWQILVGDTVIFANENSAAAPSMFLSSAAAHRIVRKGVTGAVLEPLAAVLEIGATQLAPLLGVDRTTARRYAREDQSLPPSSVETVLRLAE